MDQVVEQENVNEHFRLYVTTEPHPKFPITFLQVSFFNLTGVVLKIQCIPSLWNIV